MIKRFRQSFFGLGVPRHVLFDGDPGTGGGGAGGAGGSGGSGGGHGNGSGGAGGAGGTGGGGEKTPFAVFPDEHSFMSRVSREAEKVMAEKFKALGFDSPEAAAKALEEKRKADEAAKTDLQKAIDGKAAAEKATADQQSRADRIAIRQEARLIAKDLGFVDVDDAYKLADLSGAKVNADDTVTGVKEVLEKLAKDKPHLIQQGGGGGKPAGSGGSAGGGARGGGGGTKTPEEIAKEMAEARNKGEQLPQGVTNPWASK